jgi:hypothetical protein
MKESGRAKRTSPKKHRGIAAAQVASNAVQCPRTVAADVESRNALLQESQGAVHPEIVLREGANALCQTNEPAAPRRSAQPVRPTPRPVPGRSGRTAHHGQDLSAGV